MGCEGGKLNEILVLYIIIYVAGHKELRYNEISKQLNTLPPISKLCTGHTEVFLDRFYGRRCVDVMDA
jgi:hypothetical protein